jgi:alanyl-tRNA synthetase
VRYGWVVDIKVSLKPLIEEAVKIYGKTYSETGNGSKAIEIICAEEEKFSKTIQSGLAKAGKIFEQKKQISEDEYKKVMLLPEKGEVLGRIYASDSSGEIDSEFAKLGINITNKDIHEAYVSGKEAFDLYQTDGFPIEMIIELVQEERLFVDSHGFREELAKHQDLSRTASAGMFKGGLADSGEETRKLHTAAHLMLAALRKVLGDHVTQKGSNITSERLRFDFAHNEKMTQEQIKEVEDLVNEQITKNVKVDMDEMSFEDAKSCGAMGVFEAKYGDKVKVYMISDFSKEICGGPHAENTGDLGHFKILKEESSSAGVRRIKAILE